MTGARYIKKTELEQVLRPYTDEIVGVLKKYMKDFDERSLSNNTCFNSVAIHCSKIDEHLNAIDAELDMMNDKLDYLVNKVDNFVARYR